MSDTSSHKGLRIIERYDRQFEYAGILMNLIIAFRLYSLWRTPTLEDASAIYTLGTLMAFEFILVHSGVFMAVVPRKISLWLLFPFYGTFALAFNYALEDNTILWVYLLVIFNRMRFAFSDVPPGIKKRAILASIFSILIYFFLIIIVAIGSNSIPEWGLHPEFLQFSGYVEIKGDSGGIFIDTPHVAICFGVVYYGLLALLEALLLRMPVSNKSYPDLFSHTSRPAQ